MSVTGLQYQPFFSYSNAPVVTKNGVCIYNGNPQDFHEWQFRIQSRMVAAEHMIKKSQRTKTRGKQKETSFLRQANPIQARGKDLLRKDQSLQTWSKAQCRSRLAKSHGRVGSGDVEEEFLAEDSKGSDDDT